MYTPIIVESFYSPETSHRGRIHIRPAPNQIYSQDYFVECSRELTDKYPVGTRFRLSVKVKNTSFGRKHLYAPYNAPYEVVSKNTLVP